MARRLTPMVTTADSGHQISTPGRAFRGIPRPSGSSWSTVHRTFRNARASLLQVRPPPVIPVEIAAPGPARLMQVRPPPVIPVKIPALRPTRPGRPALGEGPGTPPQLIHALQRPRLLRPIPSEVPRHVGPQPQQQDGNQETRQKKSSLNECHVLPLTSSACHASRPPKRDHALPPSWDESQSFREVTTPASDLAGRMRAPRRVLSLHPSAIAFCSAAQARGESHDGVPARTTIPPPWRLR